MAIGGAGVRVPSTSAPAVEAWGRNAARRGGAASIRCSSSSVGSAPGVLAEEHHRTLRLRPGATKGEVKKAFRRLTLMYHPDVCKLKRDEGDCAVDFQRINVAYQILMSNMREAEERLEYWRLKYGLSDEDLERYRYYVNDQVQEDDEWLDV
ncbi:hypothetical protein PR202_gb28059 [Eleusine coracana subsp. coracana]|uniref:J domain-containing protein n=1 Tax=Eleusine coracana subsp. coracana TaxID=191504 RepID=A0AAV5FVT7_ELECO|nr:hypothetical protein QOZ80_6AG0546660 [Eleusine coracana subsp. coracana]GJN38973.1 hypothetical protein PR202_gb28059 [Eleusine coracana subsp. coracana]